MSFFFLQEREKGVRFDSEDIKQPRHMRLCNSIYKECTAEKKSIKMTRGFETF